ncbi:hypothetical protein PtA15_1A680 [Puccinia triticina]|uniref:Uncharacterized protein n=1 Tax=Puccinia triticina TaxID=208348 RepID=A0ABY7C841_9BASI|nr:uncharacterized protein PtA15_1A680 [Puccinia triticina]WAQ81340.1 hypothetical protein PtA15_1A680 [Puccinia triticina]
MSDVADEAEPKQTPDYEFLGVWADVTDPILLALCPPSPSPSSTSSTSSDDSADVPFNEMKFWSIESSDDNSFSPFIEAKGWGAGPWTTPSAGKIIFDKDALAFINKLLPQICILTWIEQALPVLGIASFGSLKADEWQNLFTVQLPLILPVHWASGGPAACSLFRNFAHLVSMVILALKRSMTSERVLLSTPEKFPEQLKPFLPQLQAIRDPITVEAETIPKYRQAFLDSTTLEALIRRLNKLFPCSTGAPWIPSDKWAEKRKAKSSKFLLVTPRIEKLSSCSINNVSFSTLRKNPNNCVIALKAGCAPHYGIIEDIFQHWRTMGNGTSRSDTWLVIQPLMPCNFSNPFAGIPKSKFELQLELRMLRTETLYVKHTQEVLAHCAWIKYKAGEILPSIKQDCIALVTLDR